MPNNSASMERIRLFSPSKINLHLRIGSPTPDGFHPLRSWMVTTSLGDTLDFHRCKGTGNVRLTCDDPAIPTDRSNLVVRAAEAFWDQLEPSERFDVQVRLLKQVPAGAGLGGGSGNAATTLRAMNRFGSQLPDQMLADLAATLGSDVPFFLGASSAIATGRGEKLSPVPAPAARFAILILPPFPIPTAHAYRVLDQLRPVEDEGTLDEFDASGWARLPAEQFLDRLTNDLERAAFAIEPRLGDLQAQVEARLGRIIRMSGSGSTLFTLFDDAAAATSAARTLQEGAGLRVETVELGRVAIAVRD